MIIYTNTEPNYSRLSHVHVPFMVDKMVFYSRGWNPIIECLVGRIKLSGQDKTHSLVVTVTDRITYNVT